MAETTHVIRPAAVLRAIEVDRVLRALTDLDVANGGVWNVSPGLWQRYDKPWDGVGGMTGSSRLVGTIGAAYGTPTRYEITLFRVTITVHGGELGWSVEALCDEALGYAGVSLATCTRAELRTPPRLDPFRA